MSYGLDSAASTQWAIQAPNRERGHGDEMRHNSDAKTIFDQIVAETGLTQNHDHIDITEVKTVLSQRYGISGRLEDIATEKDETFKLHGTDGKNYLVKCSPSSEDPALIDLQTAAMLHLEQYPELPVQRIIPALDKSSFVILRHGSPYPRTLRVLTFIQGRLLKDEAKCKADWLLAGSTLGLLSRALSTFTHPRDQRKLLWDMEHFHRLSHLLSYVDDPSHRELADTIFREYNSLVMPVLPHLDKQVIHGDFSPFNVFVDRSNPAFVTGIIDFGDIVRTSVIFDVAVGMANLIGRDPTDPWGSAEEFLRGYQRTNPLPESELVLLREISLGRLLLRALVVYWRAQVDRKRHAYLLSHAEHDWACLTRARNADSSMVRQRLRIHDGTRTGRVHEKDADQPGEME